MNGYTGLLLLRDDGWTVAVAHSCCRMGDTFHLPYGSPSLYCIRKFYSRRKAKILKFRTQHIRLKRFRNLFFTVKLAPRCGNGKFRSTKFLENILPAHVSAAVIAGTVCTRSRVRVIY